MLLSRISLRMLRRSPPGVDQDGAAAAHGTLPPRPSLPEEPLPIEVFVEFVTYLYLDVAQYVPEYHTHLLVYVCHRCVVSSSYSMSKRLGMSLATTVLSPSAVAFIML